MELLSEDEITLVADIDDKFERGVELTTEEIEAYLEAYTKAPVVPLP